jgi:thioredoxin reductase
MKVMFYMVFSCLALGLAVTVLLSRNSVAQTRDINSIPTSLLATLCEYDKREFYKEYEATTFGFVIAQGKIDSFSGETSISGKPITAPTIAVEVDDVIIACGYGSITVPVPRGKKWKVHGSGVSLFWLGSCWSN